MPGPGGHHGGPHGGPGGHHGGPHGGGHRPPMGGGMGHRPPMGGWGMGHRPPPRRRGCMGCLFPVIGLMALLIAAVFALLA